MTNYPIGDFLIRIGNAAMAGKKEVSVASTKLIKETALALKKAGYLAEVEEKKGVLNVTLAIKSKKPVLLNIKLISRPGLRIYMGANDVGKKRGPSRYLLTTPKGIMLSGEAIKANLGGEVIAEIL
ncbi:30S ribosomal protein S8 [Candidatus Woesebacteria bacterium RIFCSPHIGHO2_12_FULL_46_16]|uniref:Small ribosomal subunit protein uS8 n=3 Tax=Microgenomates group TaxID=1794810 RepID=A0A0H4TEY5_9BACT|nr:30S ribosomal protein S8, small subunit ribosomal protein S8 [uncultured Microgenomates bacterium Rifle_16ft_4_minimus_37906]AKQ05575.1 30S ribosomal protein S8, small subunit ribosomal protein S8 [uncultured Microgenomates bacterium Rifle_16ft_4_minimus_24682]OGM57956.1 MAG: 30S ribosomal protein S8 [Candidatus Woesebacteria bacterium RIFCSPHIGHO2_12_FULL_46_16]